MKEHFVITVGREYGSGGREIAKLVAQKLNVPFYDKELLTLAAQKSGICQEIFEHNDEKTSMSDMLPVTAGSGFGAGMSLGLQMPMNQRVFLAQFEVITNLAKEESCVIVGRCADYVLRDMDHVTHVFLYASLEKRVERIMRVEHVDADKARELIRKTDKQRKSYYNFFADGNWGIRANYDLMFVGLFGTANYFARLANYFLIFQSLSLPWMLKKIGGRDRKILTALMVLGFLAYFYYANVLAIPFDQDFARLSLSEYLAQLGG